MLIFDSTRFTRIRQLCRILYEGKWTIATSNLQNMTFSKFSCIVLKPIQSFPVLYWNHAFSWNIAVYIQNVILCIHLIKKKKEKKRNLLVPRLQKQLMI